VTLLDYRLEAEESEGAIGCLKNAFSVRKPDLWRADALECF
jgi:hypothetical protein